MVHGTRGAGEFSGNLLRAMRQLLSAEIRNYMASGDSGFWHTVGVLIFVGCWKHAWSVQGAVVLVSRVAHLKAEVVADNI